MPPYNQSTRPTHDLFVLEKWKDKQSGQQRQKRRIWAKGWMSNDQHNNNAVMLKFKIGSEYIYVKEILPDRDENKQTGYQADPRGFKPQHSPPAPSPVANNGVEDEDIPF